MYFPVWSACGKSDAQKKLSAQLHHRGQRMLVGSAERLWVLGVFYATSWPTYEGAINKQLEDAKAKTGPAT
jgi:hypothetical protein